MVYSHIHPETGKEALWSLKGQFLRIFNHPTDVVGQTAVGIGDIAGTLKDHDFRLLVQPADTSRSGGSSRYAPYDNDLHPISPPLLYMR